MPRSDLLELVETFNQYHHSATQQQMTVVDDGKAQVVRGPLRIYWGLSRPIQLSHCDDKPAAPASKWRHSLHAGNKMVDIPEKRDITERRNFGTMSLRRSPDKNNGSNRSRESDDISLGTSNTDDGVVRRRKKGVPKFKTVAYRGDEPTKWKRASINGHIFNYDTSVFTPVLGSCTSVVVDDGMDSMEVIATLLDKFKVQNEANEYVLSLVSEEGERLLLSTDRPLLERLVVGPHETMGKLFIKERSLENQSVVNTPHIQMPIVEDVEEENLPVEVETFMVLPEAVLRGFLAKFQRDEEYAVKKIKAKYDVFRKRIVDKLEKMSFKTTSLV